MKTYARIQDGVVAELFETDGDVGEMFHPSLTWVDCTARADVAVGWTYGGGVFAAPVVAPLTAQELLLYANKRQWALATGGYTVTVAGQPLTFSTDTTSQALMTGKALRLGQANPPATIDWQFADGFHLIAAADFMTVAIAVADYVQATFDVLKTAFAEIEAGSITTTAEIDAFAWPPNAPGA